MIRSTLIPSSSTVPMNTMRATANIILYIVYYPLLYPTFFAEGVIYLSHLNGTPYYYQVSVPFRRFIRLGLLSPHCITPIVIIIIIN